MGKTDWDVVTNYTDVVTTTLKTVTFPKVQEQVYLRNQGNANFTYTIGSQSGTLTPGQSVTVIQDVSSFTLQAVSGTHTFELRAKEKGTEINETETDVMTALAESTNYATWNAINVKVPLGTNLTPAKGDNVTDDTDNLQAIINYAQTNNLSVYLPSGTYLISGLTVSSHILIFGAGNRLSQLKNTSASNFGLKLQKDNITIKDIGIIGNGGLNGVNATNGGGILIDGSIGGGASYINIDNCFITGHGQEGIKFNQGCWIINITRSTITNNLKDGIKLDGTDGGQKNIINIDKTTLAYNGGNGIFAWGTIINITQNTIEGNLKAGVSLDGTLTATVTSAIYSTNIEGNYFESNGYGHIYLRAGGYTTPSTFYRTIYDVRIVGNYGFQDVTKFTNSITSSVIFIHEGDTPDTLRIRNVNFANNYFYLSNYTGYNVADFGNALDSSSTINFQSDPTFVNSHINMGRAYFAGQKQLVINGYFFAKGITYSGGFLESDDVASGTVIRYPVQLPSQAFIILAGLYVDTDSTNYGIQFNFKTRSTQGTGAYNTLTTYTRNTISGSGYTASPDLGYYSSSKIAKDNADIILEITITRVVTGTYLKVGNPVITYSA
jgi:hypothetical protein